MFKRFVRLRAASPARRPAAGQRLHGHESGARPRTPTAASTSPCLLPPSATATTARWKWSRCSPTAASIAPSSRPLADQMRKQLPPGVVFKLMPAAVQRRVAAVCTRVSTPPRSWAWWTRPTWQLFQAKFGEHYPIIHPGRTGGFLCPPGRQARRFHAHRQLRRGHGADRRTTSSWSSSGRWTVRRPSWSTASTAPPTSIRLDELSALTQWLAKRELGGGK